MIYANFSCTKDETLAFRVRGHAGAGRRGRDLVCAGASALASTLGQCAERMAEAGMLEGTALVELRPGDGHIRVQPRAEFREAVALVFWTAEVGFGELAASFPKNVTLEGVIRLERRGEDGK